MSKGQDGKKNGILHIIGNVVGIVLIAVLLPVMIINLTLIIKSYVRPNEVPMVFGVAPMIVESGSMQPTILVNDMIFTKKVDPAELKVDDVIAFQPIGKIEPVTHRIIEVYEENGAKMFRTQGDDNNTPDQDPVHQRQVVGVYFKRLAGVGKLALFLQQPIGMVIFVAVPLALFLLYDLLRRYFYNKKHKDERDADQEELDRLRALAASLEQGGGAEVPAPIDAAAPEYVPAPGIAAAPAYPVVEGEPEAAAEEPDLDEDDEDEV